MFQLYICTKFSDCASKPLPISVLAVLQNRLTGFVYTTMQVVSIDISQMYNFRNIILTSPDPVDKNIEMKVI